MIKLGNNNIGKIYLGSNSIGKAYLGGNLVYSKGSGPGPQPTINVAYIRGGADGSYIDTGITADNTTRVIVWARNVNPGCVFFFGSRVAFQDSSFAIVADGSSETGRIRVDYGNTFYKADDQFSNLSGYHKYELNQGVFKVDDITVATVNAGTFSNAYNIHLLGVNTAGTHSSVNFPIDICACKIYKNGVLVRDYTAVNSPSVGLYDAVSDTVFTNSGSGNFAYGTFYTNAYTPLAYVECSGAQYFDSGVPGTYEDAIVAQIMLTNSDIRFTWPLGVYDDSISPNEACGIYFGNATLLNARAYARLGSGTSSLTIDGSNSPGKYSNKKLVLLKSLNTASIYYNNTLLGSSQTASAMTSGFSTQNNMAVGTRYVSASVYSANEALIGRIYYCMFGDKRSFVPAKQGEDVGMYDTYNDIFYKSVTNTDFIAGPEL